MLDFLAGTLPQEIITEIALFEGRVFRAYLRDYVSQVYSRVYKKYFGYRYTLRIITGQIIRGVDRMGSLPFYTAWSTMIRIRYPEFLKKRKPRKHMRPYVGVVPAKRLERERVKIEVSLERYFCPRSIATVATPLIQRQWRYDLD